MATKATAPKTRKPKTNNYVSILNQFLENYNLSADFTSEQLSEHASELNALLPDWMAASSDGVGQCPSKMAWTWTSKDIVSGPWTIVLTNLII